MTDRRSPFAAMLGVAALAVGVTGLIRLAAASRPPDSAPDSAAKGMGLGGQRHAARTVTIAAPRALIHATWRDPQRLALFMKDIITVEGTAERPVWLLGDPEAPLRIETRLTEDRPGQTLRWNSVPGADLEVEAQIRLRDAPADRGTEVEGHLRYRPRLGLAGHWLSRLRGTDPEMRARQDLKRLKMLLETGEIATASNQRSL
ncbi:SRPBCC family protein [Paracoccus sp. (in: a-proteobacteria)]|uniref:SRPBCC family protein n=1 Tax=Paracoccus sp. TaxID=267 RepID=UPI00272BECB6|nr:SRPBCC family protein [Paracoccus sp. (in: a-proteobacteria)]